MHAPKTTKPAPAACREPASKIDRVDVNAITVVSRLRPISSDAVDRLAQSMQDIGQLQPIAVCCSDGRGALLVAGAHRLEAAKLLGWTSIDAVFVDGDEVDLELHEIAENLHRLDLTALQRDEQVARWIKLKTARQARVSFQPETKPQGGRPAGGVNAASRELGISKVDAHRAVKTASISDEAKQAALDAGLDDNRTALLAIAKEATSEAQTAKVAEIAATKAEAKRPAPPPPAVTALAEMGKQVRAVPTEGFKQATHLIGAVKRFAEFCEENEPERVAAGVLPVEILELRCGMLMIEAWLKSLALDLPSANKPAAESEVEVAKDDDTPPASPAEIASLANALCIALSAMDPIIDRIHDIGLEEFWRGVGSSTARNDLAGILDGAWRLQAIKRGRIYRDNATVMGAAAQRGSRDDH
jgi:ParB family chromosome partitioning protein